MTRTLYHSISALMLWCMALLTAACTSDLDESALAMDGDCLITRFAIDGQEGEIDQVAKTITVWLNPDADVTALRPEYELSEGATCNIASGSTVNFTVPVVFKVTNGNTYLDYTVTARRYEASLTMFTLADADGSRYDGIIDNDARTILVYVSPETDITRFTLNYALPDGATGDPAPGSVVDLSQPVVITISNHGAELTYTVTAQATDMPVTAFIGTAAEVSLLSDEEKAAAEWMLTNVPRSRYIGLPDIISGAVQLDPSEVKALWWHLDDDGWPSQGWDSRDMIKDYYARGGSLLLSRFACKYINDVYLIALDMKEPNAQNKSYTASMLDAPLGFAVDAPDHPVFKGMDAEKDMPIMLVDAGLNAKNTQVDWNIWDYPDHSLDGWERETGGKRLAYETDDSNKTAIVEFPARTATAGRVILVGTGGYEWNIGGDNQYAPNRITLTLNILRYLVGLE